MAKNTETRTGFFKLGTKHHSAAVQSYFSGDKDFVSETVDGSDNNQIRYFLNESEKIILFATPIQAVNLYRELAKLATCHALAEFHVIIPVIGKGVTEQHIATFYKPLGGENVTPVLFDSKRSDEQYFFSEWRRLPLWQRPLSFLARFFRSTGRALFNLSSREFDLPSYTPKVNGVASRIHYQALGTQSLFDSKTCGFHALALTTVIVDVITRQAAEAKTQCVENRIMLLNELNKTKLINKAIQLLSQSLSHLTNEPPIELRLNYLAFCQRAWQETFYSSDNSREKNSLFRLVLLPVSFLQNVLKFLLELPLKLLAESAHYFSDRLCYWAPSRLLAQYVRSFLLLANFLVYGLFEAARLLVKIMIEPQSLVCFVFSPSENVPSTQSTQVLVNDPEEEVVAEDNHSICSWYSSSSCSDLGPEEFSGESENWRSRSRSPSVCFSHSSFFSLAEQTEDLDKNLARLSSTPGKK
jgi:hypothetical protein